MTTLGRRVHSTFLSALWDHQFHQVSLDESLERPRDVCDLIFQSGGDQRRGRGPGRQQVPFHTSRRSMATAVKVVRTDGARPHVFQRKARRPRETPDWGSTPAGPVPEPGRVRVGSGTAQQLNPPRGRRRRLFTERGDSRQLRQTVRTEAVSGSVCRPALAALDSVAVDVTGPSGVALLVDRHRPPPSNDDQEHEHGRNEQRHHCHEVSAGCHTRAYNRRLLVRSVGFDGRRRPGS